MTCRDLGAGYQRYSLLKTQTMQTELPTPLTTKVDSLQRGQGGAGHMGEVVCISWIPEHT